MRGERPAIPNENENSNVKDCPLNYIKLMEDCWQQNAKDRPQMKMVVIRLEKMLDIEDEIEHSTLITPLKNLSIDQETKSSLVTIPTFISENKSANERNVSPISSVSGPVSPLNYQEMDFREWSIDNVSEWLKDTGFTNYITSFKESMIDGEMLVTLSDDDFKDLGLTNKFHVKRIQQQRTVQQQKFAQKEAKKKAIEEEQKRKQEEEIKKKPEEEKEEEKKRQEEMKRKQEEEEKRKIEEAKKIAEEKEEEFKKKQEDEKKKNEEEAKKKRDEYHKLEEFRKKQEEEEKKEKRSKKESRRRSEEKKEARN